MNKTNFVRITETVVYEADIPADIPKEQWEEWFCNQDVKDSPNVHFVEVTDREFKLLKS